ATICARSIVQPATIPTVRVRKVCRRDVEIVFSVGRRLKNRNPILTTGAGRGRVVAVDGTRAVVHARKVGFPVIAAVLIDATDQDSIGHIICGGTTYLDIVVSPVGARPDAEIIDGK